ncbi:MULTISPECIES: hypothetical protein [unclassified Mesorhizobium]|uniref:LIC10280 family protein n=1 Tax=unclassified Mesorhizobium TaxID=325217 RepID=UPI00112A6098|nr:MULTISPECIES: hypothetical protein [unclassified Mesorhizobium]MBZ9982462.1 hypothetical protein [Mesorhizobium sp. BR-1-1-8]TPL32280.1 hypothetical protein FJ947_22710 [Mesorhizobium sp. B2-4-8]TPL61140.1 hypothetical protein FJ949_23650 [Mesorhizobium sp. B2-4-1]
MTDHTLIHGTASIGRNILWCAGIVLASFLNLAPAAAADAEASARTAGQTAATSQLEGTYSVQGTNPDGSRYAGACKVTKVGENRFRFEWSVGNSYKGEGLLKGDILTVDWGSDAPVVYQVRPNGKLEGSWARGRATEVLAERKTVVTRTPDAADGSGSVSDPTVEVMKGILTILGAAALRKAQQSPGPGADDSNAAIEENRKTEEEMREDQRHWNCLTAQGLGDESGMALNGC